MNKLHPSPPQPLGVVTGWVLALDPLKGTPLKAKKRAVAIRSSQNHKNFDCVMPGPPNTKSNLPNTKSGLSLISFCVFAFCFFASRFFEIPLLQPRITRGCNGAPAVLLNKRPKAQNHFSRRMKRSCIKILLVLSTVVIFYKHVQHKN